MSKTIVALDFSSKEEVVDFLKQFDEPVYVNGSPHFLRLEIA